MAGTLGTIMGQVRLDIRQAVAGYAALRAQNQRTIYALRGSGDAFTAAGRNMTLMGAAGLYAFGKVVMAAAEFERKMDFASAVTGATGKQMQKLSDYALQLGQDTIYSAGEIADGFIELAKAGVSVKDIMGGIGVAMTNLGAAGDIPLAESGQIITSTIQQYDLAARDAVKVTDLLAGAANASIADIADIGVSLKYVGGVANAAGLSFEDTATAISLLAKAGIRGSTAGTSLRQMIVSLGGATGPARDALKELGILTEDGTNKFFTQAGEAKSLSEVFQILQNATSDLTAKERLMHLRTIFNNRALAAAAILTREGAKGFKDMNREMRKTTAADVAAARLDNLSGDIEVLKGNLETLMIQAGSPFQKMLRTWVQRITKLVQAFGKLDPKTQETIVQVFALAAASIFLMGIFNLIIGTVLKFGAFLLRLGPAIKFVWKMFKILGGNFRWAAFILRSLLGPAIAAIGTLLAGLGVGGIAVVVSSLLVMVGAWILAYKKIEIFRNAVNAWYGAIWKGIKALGAFIKLLVTDPGAAWTQLKKGFNELVNWIGDQFAKVPGLVSDALDTAKQNISQFISSAASFFAQLPGRVLGIIAAFAAKVLSYLSFRNVGYALGFLLGTVTRFFLTMGIRAATLVLNMVTRIIGFFGKLPGRIGYLLGFLVGRALGLLLKLNIRATQLASKMVSKIIGFIARLPGRVVRFIATMVIGALAKIAQFARDAPQMASDLVTGVVNFFQTLPQRVATFVANMANRAINLFTKLRQRAVELAIGLVQGFVQAIQGLPGVVAGVVGQLIEAFRGAITSAFNAAKDLAGGLWKGFKDGLGINSPSYIEEAMFQITRTMGEETTKIARRTRDVQTIAKKLAATQFTMPGMEGLPDATRGYARLASMQARNDQRARTLLERSGRRGDRAAAGRAARRATQAGEVPFHITNWREGRGMMRNIAQDVVDEESDYSDTLGRMG